MRNYLFLLFTTSLLIIAMQIDTAAQERTALYRYTAPKSKNDVYAASDTHRALYKQKFYKEINAVGYIYLTKQPGTVPLYHYLRQADGGVLEHFYTSNPAEAAAKDSAGSTWALEQFNKGIVGYVPKEAEGAETKPVYRFIQPNGSTNIYVFSSAEFQGMTQSGLSNKGVAFYVYKKSSAPTPDLQIGAITGVTDRSVSFSARSIGGDIGSNMVIVAITAYDVQGKQLWQQMRLLGAALPNGKITPLTVNLESTSDKTLNGIKFKLKIDGDDRFVEPSENNNESQLTDGPAIDYQKVFGKDDKKPVIISPLPALPAVDLTLRNALYFNRLETAKVRTDSVFATPAKPLTLSKSQAVACDEEGCEFWLGFIVLRAGGSGEQLANTSLSVAGFGVVSKAVKFTQGERAKDVVFGVKLKFGSNQITARVDEGNRITESDENNNGFQVFINLEK